MNLVKEKQGGLVPPGLKRWPFKLIKHFADTTRVSPSPAGPAGCCPLNFLNLINLKFRVRAPNGCCISVIHPPTNHQSAFPGDTWALDPTTQLTTYHNLLNGYQIKAYILAFYQFGAYANLYNLSFTNSNNALKRKIIKHINKLITCPYYH